MERHDELGGELKPSFAYTVVYVRDVATSLSFYTNAFGFIARRLNKSNKWGELDTGSTTIAFTPSHQHETDDITGQVVTPISQHDGHQVRPPVEVCFAYADVDAAYKRAVENGAVPVHEPEEKVWGQKVGYVRDIDGIVVRMGSYVNSQVSSKHGGG